MARGADEYAQDQEAKTCSSVRKAQCPAGPACGARARAAGSIAAAGVRWAGQIDEARTTAPVTSLFGWLVCFVAGS